MVKKCTLSRAISETRLGTI